MLRNEGGKAICVEADVQSSEDLDTQWLMKQWTLSAG